MSVDNSAPVHPATERRFPSVFKLIRPSWEAFKLNWGALVQLMLAPLAAYLAPLIIVLPFNAMFDADELRAMRWILAILIMLFTFYVVAVTQTGSVAAQLKSAEKAKTTFKESWQVGHKYWLRMIGLGLCLVVIFVVSVLLFVIPFFFMLKRYALAPYYLIDRNLGVFEALRQSAADSKRFPKPLWGLVGGAVLFNIVTTILVIIPIIGWLALLVLIFWVMCVPAVLYVELRGASKAAAPAIAQA